MFLSRQQYSSTVSEASRNSDSEIRNLLYRGTVDWRQKFRETESHNVRCCWLPIGSVPETTFNLEIFPPEFSHLLGEFSPVNSPHEVIDVPDHASLGRRKNIFRCCGTRSHVRLFG